MERPLKLLLEALFWKQLSKMVLRYLLYVMTLALSPLLPAAYA